MDYSLKNHGLFVGKPISDLPCPAFVLSKPKLEANVKEMLNDVASAGLSFRPHVKTLKSLEVTRLMLGNGKHRKAIASTLCEIQGMLPLVNEGVLDECLYGLPVGASALPRLADLSQKIKIVLMIDCDQQVDLLEQYNQRHADTSKWSVFIKVDVGTHRAGIPLASEAMRALVKKVDESSAAELYGFYCHAGHSYDVKSTDEAAQMLHEEVSSVIEASKLITQQTEDDSRRLVISVGATPTAHVVRELKTLVPEHLELELHAGNFCVNDLQQLSTGLITPDHLAIRIQAEVCSVYPHRNQALINAGVIALTRESSSFTGHGKLVNQAGWSVVKVSQEHGILGIDEHDSLSAQRQQQQQKVQDVFQVGQKVLIWCQHACITASNFHVYYVVDDKDVVIDAWVPWKGW